MVDDLYIVTAIATVVYSQKMTKTVDLIDFMAGKKLPFNR